MNLANLVHHHRHNANKSAYPKPQQRIIACRTRAAQVYDREMASALTASPYTSQPPVYAQLPQHPPSPSAEDFSSKCTLPSIQSLIGMTATPAPKSDQQRKFLHHREPPPELIVPTSGSREATATTAATARAEDFRSNVSNVRARVTRCEQLDGYAAESYPEIGFWLERFQRISFRKLYAFLSVCSSVFRRCN